MSFKSTEKLKANNEWIHKIGVLLNKKDVSKLLNIYWSIITQSIFSDTCTSYTCTAFTVICKKVSVFHITTLTPPIKTYKISASSPTSPIKSKRTSLGGWNWSQFLSLQNTACISRLKYMLYHTVQVWSVLPSYIIFT